MYDLLMPLKYFIAEIAWKSYTTDFSFIKKDDSEATREYLSLER